MQIKELKFIYVNEAVLTISGKSLKDAVTLVLTNTTVPKVEPLAVVFPSTGKQLYFDRNLFEAFAKGEMSQEEIVKQTTVTGLYRNKTEIKGHGGEIVEPESLWKLQDKKLILIDDDCHIEAFLDPNYFHKIE